MLLVVEILLIILRSIGASINVECSAAAKCMRKCMGGGVLGYSPLIAVSFFVNGVPGNLPVTRLPLEKGRRPCNWSARGSISPLKRR